MNKEQSLNKKLKDLQDKSDALIESIATRGDESRALGIIDEKNAVQAMIDATEHKPCTKMKQCALDVTSYKYQLNITNQAIDIVKAELQAVIHDKLAKEQAAHDKKTKQLVKELDELLYATRVKLGEINDYKDKVLTTEFSVRVNAGNRSYEVTEGDSFESKGMFEQVRGMFKHGVVDSKNRMIIGLQGEPLDISYFD